MVSRDVFQVDPIRIENILKRPSAHLPMKASSYLKKHKKEKRNCPRRGYIRLLYRVLKTLVSWPHMQSSQEEKYH